MVVVTIVAILAAISLPMLGTYINRSRATEATGFLSEIKARQESYRFDFGMYCDVSSGAMNLWPTVTPPRGRTQAWAPDPKWNTLGATPAGRSSLFVYSTTAGVPGTQPAFPGANPARGYATDDFWFISMAVGDVDGDGITMMIESYSHSKGLWVSTGDNVE
jgi:type II secretory pathway pseudopilin PulG